MIKNEIENREEYWAKLELYAETLKDFVQPGSTAMLCLPAGPESELIAAALEKLDVVSVDLGLGKSYAQLKATMAQYRPELYVGQPVALLSLLRVCGKGSLKKALVSNEACADTVINEIEDVLCTPLWGFCDKGAMRIDRLPRPAEDEMCALEDKLFSLGALADCRLSRVPSGYKLEGLYTGWMDPRQIGDVCPHVIAVKLRELSMDDVPLYSGKRTIE